MTVTDTAARLTVRWAADLDIEPGSVPDRAVTRGRGTYRPGRLSLAFGTSAVSGTPRALQMEAGSGIMRQARDQVRADGIVISGKRLKNDGTPGEQEYRETFYGPGKDGLPDWALALLEQVTADLGGTL